MPRNDKPSPKRRPDIPRGKPAARTMNPNRPVGAALSLAEVEAIRVAFASLRSERGVEKATGIARNTIRRYLREGDPLRGIAPLLDSMPPPPAPEAPPPGLVPSMHAPVSPDDLGDDPGDDDGPDDPPDAAPFTDPAPTPPGRPLGAPVAPAGAPVAPAALPGPSAPLQGPSGAAAGQPRVPGVGAPLPAAPIDALPEGPTDGKGATIKSVEHTVTVANAELARLSRNTRALYHARMRALTRLVDVGTKAVADGAKGKALSPAQRELLMVCREARVRPIELLALHRAEVGILGTTEAASAAGNIDATDDVRTIEGMRDELKELLAERANLLDDDDDDPAISKSLPSLGGDRG